MNTTTKNFLLTPFNILYNISPKVSLQILYKLKTGEKLNLKNPKNYNEKLQWIKLFDKNPLMPECSDKYHVRQYVEKKGLGNILNELYWQGDDPEKIPFDKLPEKFVIKVTHGSTFNIICESKKDLNISHTKKLLRKWLKEDFIKCYGEWFYGVMKPRIIVEKYLLDDKTNKLFDYKFFCFNGEPKLVYVDTWKDNKHTINAYDMDFNIIKGVKLGYDNDLETPISKPANMEKMINYAKVLSQDFNHVRVDFYEVNNEVIFGELTFTKSAGYGKIEPESFNLKMGSWLKIDN